MPPTFNQKVIARIPASTTNLGPGFDVLGLALQLYSKVTLETTETDTQVVVSGVDADKYRHARAYRISSSRTCLQSKWHQTSKRLQIADREWNTSDSWIGW